MSAENETPVADQMRRIEDAFTEGGERSRAEPSTDAIRAAEALLFAGGEPITAKALGEKLGPAVDVAASGTRHEEKLLAPAEGAVVGDLRKQLAAAETQAALQKVIGHR